MLQWTLVKALTKIQILFRHQDTPGHLKADLKHSQHATPQIKPPFDTQPECMMMKNN